MNRSDIQKEADDYLTAGGLVMLFLVFATVILSMLGFIQMTKDTPLEITKIVYSCSEYPDGMLHCDKTVTNISK